MVGKTSHLSFDTKKDAMGKKVLHVLKAEGDRAAYLLELFAKWVSNSSTLVKPCVATCLHNVQSNFVETDGNSRLPVSVKEGIEKLLLWADITAFFAIWLFN